MPAGTLFIVATPIGNLGDLTPRALETLRGVAAICAEDTRRSGQLLSHFGVSTPLIALHARPASGSARCQAPVRPSRP